MSTGRSLSAARLATLVSVAMEANLHKLERKYLYPDHDTGGLEADCQGRYDLARLVGNLEGY